MMKPLEFERISVEEAAKTIERNVRPRNVKEWDGDRRAGPAAVITEDAAAWLASLATDVRPLELARQFPRIANKLCELWKRPAQCDVYIRELMMNDRDARKGFPDAVGREISVLASHYATVHPYRHSIWDDVLRT